jgi:hypothetical protein
MRVTRYYEAMKHTLFRNKKEFKGKIVLEELKRAHLIIVILSLVIVIMLLAESTVELRFDPILSILASVLLLLMALISASIVLYLRKK